MATQQVGVDSRLPNQIDRTQIIGGPSKLELLLAQYDHPREVIFKVRNPANGRESRARCSIRSVTLHSDGRIIVVGDVKISGGPISGGPSGNFPMYADYDPEYSDGIMVVNLTGKGIAVIYIPPNGKIMSRFDTGEKQASPDKRCEQCGQPLPDRKKVLREDRENITSKTKFCAACAQVIPEQ